MTSSLTAQDTHRRRRGWARVGRVSLRMLATFAILGGSVAFAGLTAGTPAVAADASCATGVTVVVDFTDLGGKLDVACAEGDQATGRAALIAAGFTATDSQPGFLCAINSLPDPCPETFAGSFWSYWHSTADGEWSAYQVGADSSTPVTGELEGWRYNDGTIPPGITPAEAAASASATPEPEPTFTTLADPDASTSDESATTTTTPGEQLRESQNAAITFTTIGFFVVIAGLVALFVIRSRRRRPGALGADPHSPDSRAPHVQASDSRGPDVQDPDSHGPDVPDPDSHGPESRN